MYSCSKLLTVAVLAFLSIHLSVPWINASNDDPALISLTEAEEALASSYETVLAAEQLGANVSTLLDQFAIGCEYLSEAHIWHRLGNADNTSYFSALCYDVAENIETTASDLCDETKSLTDANFVASAFVSIVAIVAILVSSFLVWRIFKRHYYRRLLGLKPEVVSK